MDTPAARVLRFLHKEGAANMRRFTEVSTHSPKHAKILRERMEARGLIVVRDEAKRKITTDKEIDLTPKGRKVAEHFAAIATLTEK